MSSSDSSTPTSVLRNSNVHRYIELMAMASLGLIIVTILANLYFVVSGTSEDQRSVFDKRMSPSLSERTEKLQSWLETRDVKSESYLFNEVAAYISTFGSSLPAESSSRKSSDFFAMGLLNVAFFLIASWRAWLFGIVGTGLFHFFTSHAYAGKDFLGKLGNGRKFFSGIRIGFAGRSEEELSKLWVPGLAIPSKVSLKIFAKSPLHGVMKSFNVLNDTNTFLGRVLLSRGNFPSYLIDKSSATAITKDSDTPSVEYFAAEVLKAFLDRHAALASGGHITALRAESPYPEVLASHAFRTLTQLMTDAIAATSATEITTAFLAWYCGRIFTIAEDGDGWTSTSIFPELTARAILHSIPSLDSDYDGDIRTRLRRALVYSPRTGLIEPPRMPLYMEPDLLALRGWVELLGASPVRLASQADEVEFFNRSREADEFVKEVVEKKIQQQAKQFFSTSIATDSLLFLPFSTVIAFLREALPIDVLNRLGELSSAVYQTMKLQAIAEKLQPTASSPVEFMKLATLAPLAVPEIKKLSTLYQISVADLVDWSAARSLLATRHWVPGRVGESKAPIEGIGFVAGIPIPGEGVKGYGAFVPLRRSKLSFATNEIVSMNVFKIVEVAITESVSAYDTMVKTNSLEMTEIPADNSSEL